MSLTRLNFDEPSIDAVRELLRAMEGRRVLVVGDGMVDGYIHGTASRLSPEAPVQVVQVEREVNLLGGAANVAKCLVALGARVDLVCVVGADAAGDGFVRDAESLRIDTQRIVRDPSRPTTVKTRVVSGRQHLLRIDRESPAPLSESVVVQLIAAVESAARDADAILLSDYDKGVLTEAVCAAAIRAAAGRPVLVDPKGTRWQKYAGATLLKPNFKEACAFLSNSAPQGSDDATAEGAAESVRSACSVRSVLLTRSEHGASLTVGESGAVSWPTRATTVHDEAGAGDAVAATACLALAAGAPLPLAAWLGNLAGGVKVAKFGTHAVSDHELLEALGEHYPASERKLMTAQQAAMLAANLRGGSRRVVFTNGCFDILHLGHVTYLEKARRLGDALIVGVNTDASVRRLKGPERPVNSEGDRARVLSSLGCVDAVVLFGEDTPLELITAIRPDILCKGADYRRKEDVVGWDVVEAHGGRVALIELVEGRSTSNVISKMKG